MTRKNWRQSKSYRRWRIRIIRKYKRCVICNSIKHRHAHHINSGEHHTRERYLIRNGVCLCSICHRQFHTNYMKSYQELCTRYDYDNFMELIKYIKSIVRKYD